MPIPLVIKIAQVIYVIKIIILMCFLELVIVINMGSKLAIEELIEDFDLVNFWNLLVFAICRSLRVHYNRTINHYMACDVSTLNTLSTMPCKIFFLILSSLQLESIIQPKTCYIHHFPCHDLQIIDNFPSKLLSHYHPLVYNILSH